MSLRICFKSGEKQKQMEESRLKNQGAITSLKQILKDMK
jgi:hypothetical protein